MDGIIIFLLVGVFCIPNNSHGFYLQNQNCEISLCKTQLFPMQISTYSFITSQIDSQFQRRVPTFGTICFEWLGATTGGTVVGLLFGFTYTWIGKRFNWFPDEPESHLSAFIFSGHMVGYTFGSALGTSVIGKLLKQRGRFLSSLVWSIGGETISWGIGWTLGPSPWVYIFIVPQSFAVIGYNLHGTSCCGIGGINHPSEKIYRYNQSVYYSVLKMELVKFDF